MRWIGVEFGPSSPLKRAARRSADFANQTYNGWPELGRSRVNAAGSQTKGCARHHRWNTTWQRLPPTGCATSFLPELFENVQTPIQGINPLATLKHRSEMRSSSAASNRKTEGDRDVDCGEPPPQAVPLISRS
jgi:hypothetical protein